MITINVISLDWSIFKYFKDMKSFLYWGPEIGFDIKTFAAIDFDHGRLPEASNW